MRIRKILAVAGVAITATAMSAPQTFNISFGGESSSNASSAESDTVKSIGRGVGVNETEALKDAYRDAIERAIGLYVDAETVAKNDEIVKDQILTQSNAYITHYDKVKTTNISGGLVEVRIVATVKKRALTKKVSAAMPGAKIDVSSSLGELHAQMTTKENRSQDGAALLENVLKDMDLSKLLRVSIASNKPVVSNRQTTDGHHRGRGRNRSMERAGQSDSNQDKIRLGYLFKFEIDKERYFKEVLPPIKEVMDQISITPPKTIRFNVTGEDDPHNDRTYFSYRNSYLNAGEKFEEQLHTMGCTAAANYNLGFFDGLKCFRAMVQEWNTELMFSYRHVLTRAFGDDQGEIKNGLVAVLIAEVNSGSAKGVQYTLDFEAAKVLDRWQSSFTGAFRRPHKEAKPMQFDIVFKDADGGEVSASSWNFNYRHGNGGGCGVCWNAGFVGSRKRGNSIWIMTPFVGVCAERYLEWHAFDFNKDDLVKIKQLSIERTE